MGRRRNNPDSRTFGSQDDTIRNSKTFRLTSGNSRKEEEQNFEILCRTFGLSYKQWNVRSIVNLSKPVVFNTVSLAEKNKKPCLQQ